MKQWVIGAFLVLFGSCAAWAADLPVRKAVQPYAAPIVDNWWGVYVGVRGGQNLGRYDPFFGGGEDVEARTINLKDNSWLVGGHIGYLLQPGNGIFVFGPEIGFQRWDLKSEGEVVPATLPTTGEIVIPGTPAVSLQQRVDWALYFNMRGGISLFNDTAFLYVGGGGVLGHVKSNLVNVIDFNTAFDQSVFGWDVEAGLDVKFGKNVVVGAKYRHIDFGNVSPGNPALALIGLEPSRLRVDQIVGTLSWQFSKHD